MKNLLSQADPNRMATLIAREERLIEANKRHGYVNMVLTKTGLQSNPKEDRYTKCLLAIHKEKVSLWRSKRENNESYKQNLANAKKAVAGMITNNEMFNLTPFI